MKLNNVDRYIEERELITPPVHRGERTNNTSGA
jgi:hypothetical protein